MKLNSVIIVRDAMLIWSGYRGRKYPDCQGKLTSVSLSDTPKLPCVHIAKYTYKQMPPKVSGLQWCGRFSPAKITKIRYWMHHRCEKNGSSFRSPGEVGGQRLLNMLD
jgi:hypothetical protein